MPICRGINKAHDLYNKGKCDEAIKAYDNAKEIDPQYAKSSKFALDWHNKARTLYNKGKYDEAIYSNTPMLASGMVTKPT